jgi:uncharacterized membrane protein (DUF485 family)
MQDQEFENTPSLTQRAYTIAKSLRSASYWLLALTLLLLFFSLLAFISYSISFSKSNPNVITGGSLIIIIFISSYIVGWFIIKARHEYRRINKWNEDYLHSSYTLIFDTSVPKGNTTGEKVLSLAKLVFPELRDDFAISIWDEPNAYAFVSALIKRITGQNNKSKLNGNAFYEKDFTIDSYVLDLFLKTKAGYFIVKDFGNRVVTTHDLHQLLTICNKLRGKTPAKNIFRIISVAENYDDDLLDRESLEKLMAEKLQSDFKIDLLHKETNGYSVLWVS